MPDTIPYERDVPSGALFVETTDAGTTFYLPPPTLWPLGCLAGAAAVILAGIGLLHGGRLGWVGWSSVIFYGLVLSLAVVFYFRQRRSRHVIEVNADGVRFSSAVRQSYRGWFVSWKDVEAIERRHVPKIGELIELRGTHPRRAFGGGSLTPPQLDAIRDALERGHAKFLAHRLGSP